MEKTSSTGFLKWRVLLQRSYNWPSRADFYSANIVATIANLTNKEGSEVVRPEHRLLKMEFKKPEPKETEEELVEETVKQKSARLMSNTLAQFGWRLDENGAVVRIS